MRILLTRPEAPGLKLKEKLEALGHQVALAPVLSIEPAEFSIDPTGVGGIVMTSASAAPALTSAGFSKDTPVFAIGSTSAEAARGQGFDSVISGDGDRASFVDLIAARHDPAAGSLLHLAGSHRAGDIVAELQALGMQASGVQVYEAVAAPDLPSHICDQVRGKEIDAILFFSPRSARTFISLAADNGFGAALSDIAAICLSETVMEAARPGGWKTMHVSAALNEVAMIEALKGIIDNGK